MSFCENCGGQLGENDKFCQNCGSAVPKRETPQQPAAEDEAVQGMAASSENQSQAAGEPVPTPPPAPNPAPEGKGDEGVHEWHYGKSSTYSRQTVGIDDESDWYNNPASSYPSGIGGKGKHEGLAVKIAIIVVIVVVVLILLFFLGIRKASRKLGEYLEEYSISEELKEETADLPLYEESALNGYWFGEISVIADEDFSADANDEDLQWAEVTAYIGESSSGRKFLEVYDENYYEDTAILSLYINETYYGFSADIGEEDAWIYDMYLSEEEAGYFNTAVAEGEFYIIVPYMSEGGDYWVVMRFYKE